jgi:serine/threonine protein phosphatase 1
MPDAASPAPFPAQRLRARPGGGLERVSGLAPGRRWRGARSAEGGTEGQRVYAVGDVHGLFDLLQALLEAIAADAAGRPHLLVFAGDYIDRGPDSARVLERLVGLRRARGEGVLLLKGNHEQALLRFLDDPAGGRAWIERFGGAATLGSYGLAVPPAGVTAAELVDLRDALLDDMPAAHLRLLQDLDLMVVLGDYAFVHAGVGLDGGLAEQTEDDLLWARKDFLARERAFEKIIVHGHTWAGEAPQLLDHRIGVDTGAYETGVLTAVSIEDAERGVVQARDAAAEARRAEAQRLSARPAFVRSLPDYLSLAPAGLVIGGG